MGWRWVLLEVYFKTETEFLGNNLVLERSASILAALDPLCCSGCPWAVGSVEHLLCCYGNTSSGVPGKAADMVFVEWRVKSGFTVLLREISTPAFAAMLWIQDVWRCNLHWEQILFISMWNHDLGAAVWDGHLHPFLCYCNNSLIAAQGVRNPHSQLPPNLLQFIELSGASGPEVQCGVSSAPPHLFHTAQVFNTNQLAFWVPSPLWSVNKTHEVKSWGVLGWECADKAAPVQLPFILSHKYSEAGGKTPHPWVERRGTPSTAHPAFPNSFSPADAAPPLPWSCLPSKAGTRICGRKTFWRDSSEPCNFWGLFQCKFIFLCFGWRMCELGSSRVYLKDFFLLTGKTKPLTFWSPFKHPAQGCSKVFTFIIFTPSFSLKMSKAHITLELLECSTVELQELWHCIWSEIQMGFAGGDLNPSVSTEHVRKKVGMMLPESAFVWSFCTWFAAWSILSAAKPHVLKNRARKIGDDLFLFWKEWVVSISCVLRSQVLRILKSNASGNFLLQL